MQRGNCSVLYEIDGFTLQVREWGEVEYEKRTLSPTTPFAPL